MKNRLISAFLLLPLLLHSGTPLYGAEAVYTDSGTTSWMLTSTALVLLMIPPCHVLRRSGADKECDWHHDAQFRGNGHHRRALADGRYALSFGPGVLGGFVGWDPQLFMLQGIDDTIMDRTFRVCVRHVPGKFAIITRRLLRARLLSG